ncbi:hypothetical protein [Planomonospora algeriensis]
MTAATGLFSSCASPAASVPRAARALRCPAPTVMSRTRIASTGRSVRLTSGTRASISRKASRSYSPTRVAPTDMAVTR